MFERDDGGGGGGGCSGGGSILGVADKGAPAPKADLSRNRVVISTAAAYCCPTVDHCSTDRQVNELAAAASTTADATLL